MTATPLLLASHPACGRHLTIPGHPERPERLGAALDGALALGAQELAVSLDEERVLAAVARVHDPSLAERLRGACRVAPGFFDCPDNSISEGSFAAACGAVAAALAAVDAIQQEVATTVWVAVRPPGHHATYGEAMGFCFFNNVAVAAEELTQRGVSPVAIVDFDVHHGNGTQDLFWERDDVFYLSVHRYPFYPGTGSASEIGAGKGRGFTRNLPLASGADDDTYCEAIEVGLNEVLAAMTPQAWLVSAGFDAHHLDPLGGMHVTTTGFGRIGRLLAGLRGGRPVVALLEGGYNLQALRESVTAFLGGVAVTAAT